MPYSLYLHIPFCTHRCAYCDFNTYAGQESLIPAYVRALCTEIEAVGKTSDQGESNAEVHTIFFGGGTPSLLSPDQFAIIISTIRATLDLRAEAEITIEANPGTVSSAALERLRRLGINRISFGVQSANTEELQLLERQHSFFDVIAAVRWAREAGFDNLNLDLIYGLPEQRLPTWQNTLKRAVDLAPQHLSLYALTLEHGTPFGRWAARGLLPLPDPDLAAEMYEWATDYLSGAGYVQYEISNWARQADRQPLTDIEQPAYACRHNLQYWRLLPYFGLGAGAHGYVGGFRYSNSLRIRTYIERLQPGAISPPGVGWPITSAAVNHHKNTLHEDMSEMMITGLRLTREGISVNEFKSRFGIELENVYKKEIERMIGRGLLEWVGPPRSHSPDEALPGTHDRLRLTPRARLLANQVFMEFVD